MNGNYIFLPIASSYDYHPDVYGWGHTAVNIAVVFVCPLLISREGGKLVVFDMAVTVGFLIFDDVSLTRQRKQVLFALALRNVGKPALDDGGEE